MTTNRIHHYCILLVVFAAIMLPNLGATSLWDMDEGVNAECTREMMETGTWVVPTYNYELRTAKPVLLYWLQRASYNVFGINEGAARLPSVLMSFLTVIAVYELGRRMFGPLAGLLGGVILASSMEFVKLAHAATPDATFICFSTLTLVFFYLGQREGRRGWFVPCAVASGLAVLTKGPAGVAMPGFVIVLFLAWNRELRRLWDRRLLQAAIVFVLVAVPWYALVAAETRGAYIRAFFGNENVNRFLSPMENHKGPFYYYLGAILIFFAPWSVVIGGTIWYGWKNALKATPKVLLSPLPGFAGRGRERVETGSTEEPSPSPSLQSQGGEEETRSHRFLIVWVFTYLVFFSFAATKLPNYIAPLYPALALLTASFLQQWCRGTLPIAKWLMPAAVGGMVLTGLVIGGGLLSVGGIIPAGARTMPALAPWAALGLLPLAGAVAMIVFLKRQQRERFTGTIAFVSVSFAAILAAFPLGILDSGKAAKSLVEESGAKQTDRDIRLASLEYTQESMTFYAERRVERLRDADAAKEFLAMPRPGYLFVPAKLWNEQLSANVGPHRVAARRFDHFRNAEILAITTDGVQP